MPALGYKDIGGLDVAVDDTFGVSRVQGVRNLDSQRQNQLGFERTPCDAMLQRQAIQKFHGDEVLPSPLANLVRSCRY